MANPVSVTGKSCTITYGTYDASAQITDASVSRSKSTETLQTLGGSAIVGSETSVEVSVNFLFEPSTSGFYSLLHAAWKANTTASVSIKLGDGTLAVADVLVTGLEDQIPADGFVTCTATLATSQADVFTGKA